MKNLEAKFTNLVSLEEIIKLKQFIKNQDYAGKNQELIDMIQSQKDKIFMEQINEANPEVRGALNQMMKN
jgi:hypothetical protein